MGNLENLENEIKSYAESKGLKIIEGFFVREVNQVLSKKENFKEFLDSVADLDSKLIVLDVKEFNESFFESEKEIEETLEKLDKIKEKYNAYVGKPFQIKISLLKEGFSISFEETASWFEEFMDEFESIETEIKEDKFSICKECGEKFRDFKTDFFDTDEERLCMKCQSKKQKEAEEILIKISDKLAEDEEFAKCKNPVERDIYLEKNYPEIKQNEFISTYKLNQRAKAIRDLKRRGI